MSAFSQYAFFVNKVITVNQNTQLSVIPLNNYEVNYVYDYLLDVNVVNAGYTMNTMFSVLNYYYVDVDSAGGDKLVSNMYFSNTVLTSIFQNPAATRVIGTTSTSTQSPIDNTFTNDNFPPNADTMANKFKEIIAAKIFGAAVATGALTRSTHDTFDTSIPSNFQISLYDTFTQTGSHYNEYFFQQYVASNRFEYDQDKQTTNTIGKAIPYNLAGTRMDFPVWFNGVITDPDGIIVSTTNYPSLSIASTRVTKAATTYFNIPLLLSLHD